jgi:hypothetical protein
LSKPLIGPYPCRCRSAYYVQKIDFSERASPIALFASPPGAVTRQPRVEPRITARIAASPSTMMMFLIRPHIVAEFDASANFLRQPAPSQDSKVGRFGQIREVVLILMPGPGAKPHFDEATCDVIGHHRWNNAVLPMENTLCPAVRKSFRNANGPPKAGHSYSLVPGGRLTPTSPGTHQRKCIRVLVQFQLHIATAYDNSFQTSRCHHQRTLSSALGHIFRSNGSIGKYTPTRRLRMERTCVRCILLLPAHL